MRTLGPLPASLLALGLIAQAPPPTPTPGPGPGGPAAPRPAGAPGLPGAPGAEAEPKPYDKVITPEAKTQPGLFKVHRVKSKLYFEIPKALLGSELLLVATAQQVPEGVNHAGSAVAREVVRFTLHENKVYLQGVSHAYMSDPGKAIAPAVAASQRDTILRSFSVEAFSKDGAPVIDAGGFFTSEVGPFTAKGLLNATMLDVSRSYVDQAKAFPTSLRVDAVQTYTLASPFAGATPIPGMPTPPARSGSVLMAYSLVQLPGKPMMPRHLDDRVGYFGISRVDYGSDEHESKRERFIARWRLEKKDPSAALSEPVKPIVWYIDRNTPTALVPYVKKGVEAWNVAFEAAGFKNAVQARTFPTKEQDPEFDPEDIRYSVIRWVPSPIANAYGPHISDPRTGEILNADIVMYHNILQLQRDWYFTQVGPLDKRAQKLPLPDDLMGELVAYVVTHECGHSLGFPHNMKSSSLYPIEKIRDKAWLKEMGHVATLMDYSRFNYVAQPEDGIDPELLRPKVGPYDLFAVKWGYQPIPGAKTPKEEKATLDAWALEQDAKPWLRFSTPRAAGSDPGENTEAVGDADAVKATTLGTKNLQRVLAMLPAAVEKPGESDDTLEHLYRAVWGQWSRELGHVAAIVGGFDSQNKHQGQKGPVFTPVPRARQKDAVRYLNEAVFRTPQWILDKNILARLSPASGSTQLLGAQRSALRALLDRGRTLRLQEQEALLGDQAYKLTEMLADLRDGIFGELKAAAPRVEPMRRNLQRAYLEQLDERLNRPAPSVPPQLAAFVQMAPNLPDDTRGAIRAELRSLQAAASAKAAVAGDRGTRAHLEDVKDQISKILDPRFAPAAGSSPSVFRLGVQDACWPSALPEE
ncbi:MAG: zinc-dependent metalloprotease [Acidobacteria bacterium]|nr:zinc-dependent metalloprotease [Acidobacteriota bacterium]